jgi:hypothetical protein
MSFISTLNIIKVNFSLCTSRRHTGRSRNTASLNRNFGARRRWVVTSRPGRFDLVKEHQYPLNRKLCGLQGRSGRFGGKYLTSTGIRTPARPLRSLVAIPTALLRLHSNFYSYFICKQIFSTIQFVTLYYLSFTMYWLPCEMSGYTRTQSIRFHVVKCLLLVKLPYVCCGVDFECVFCQPHRILLTF